MADNSYTDIMEKNHMEIPWHDYTTAEYVIMTMRLKMLQSYILRI